MNDRTRDSYRAYSDQDTQFLFGVDLAELSTVDARGARQAAIWNRTLADAGLADELSRIGVNLANFPTDQVVTQVAPDSTRVGSITIALDVATMLASQFRGTYDADAQFERSMGDRWKKTPDRVQGYIPADLGSIRWTMLPQRLFDGVAYANLSSTEAQIRIDVAIGAAWAYMSTPFFIPAGIALDVVTAEPPPADTLHEMRLPARYTLLFHDGIPVPIAMGNDDDIDAFGDSAFIDDETLIIGGILAANDDGTIYTDQGCLIMARRDNDGWYGWQPIRTTYGNHPAGRVLHNYAALLAWENWTNPPPLPVSDKGKPGSANQLKKAARSDAARNGAWHGVHILNYRPPPPPRAEPTAEPGRRAPLTYRTTRRAHWTKNTRIGIRDADDQLIGPVYGPNAVEGETYERRRVFVRRADVRPDLPERPTQTVYRIPTTTRPT